MARSSGGANRKLPNVRFVPIADTGPLLNNLIGCGEELGWDGQPKRFSGLEVDHEIELCWLLDR